MPNQTQKLPVLPVEAMKHSSELMAGFEKIGFTDQYGKTFWYASSLQDLLNYMSWDNFEQVITKAKKACLTTNCEAENFEQTERSFRGTKRKVKDYILSRHAAFLVIQNADPSKTEVAALQAYLAVQAHRQELTDANHTHFEEESEIRVILRHELSRENKALASMLKKIGITEPNDYARFQRAGYEGLYAGLTSKVLRSLKGIAEKEPLPDHMGALELLANFMRVIRVHEVLAKERSPTLSRAISIHRLEGENVRNRLFAEKIDMPEALPPAGNVKNLEND